ncbi:MAG: hypothetical protein WA667_30155, partial [Candidatus Nitrosopolaris sp.]
DYNKHHYDSREIRYFSPRTLGLANIIIKNTSYDVCYGQIHHNIYGRKWKVGLVAGVWNYQVQ